MKLLNRMAGALMITLASLSMTATSWTVSNNPDRPAQFTVLQTAIDAADPGDTILITGGTYTGTTTLVKNLVLYGEAIEGSEFPITYLNMTLNFTRFNSSLGSDGSRMYGIQLQTLSINPDFSGSLAGQETLDDIIFERCRFTSSVSFYPYDGISNVTFRNCFYQNCTFRTSQTAQTPVPVSSILVTNCVFENSEVRGYSSGGTYDVNGNVVIRNSVFIDRVFSCFVGLTELVLENNIFYAAEFTGLTNSTFNNNLSYLCNDNTIPYGSNLGSGNIENADPEFINFPALGGNHSWSYDYGLSVTSPAAGTGTSGTNIGLTGGNAPVNNLPRYAKIPGVTVLDIPVSSVPVGGTLQINIEAESRD